MRYILAVDQGTTGTRAVLFDERMEERFSHALEHRQITPRPGWAEHDPNEIWKNIRTVAESVLQQAEEAGIPLQQVVAMGLANQGETALAWDKNTGEPLCNAIVWHCKRTESIVQRLQAQEGLEAAVRERTGLMIDSYFSALKMLWMKENLPQVQQALEEERCVFGTLDAWLLRQLTGNDVTDVATASRTMLLNIHTLDWDDTVLEALGIGRETLPQVLPNCACFGQARLKGHVLPMLGAAVDQQAALFGQHCFAPGMAKATYGTGCFLLMNTGEAPVFSRHGLLTSVGWKIGDRVSYVLDGGIYMAGAVMQWLRDKLGVIEHYGQLDENAFSVQDNGGVYFVTAFAGLSAPTWDAEARGTVVGMTTGTGRAHLVRAAMESVAYQVCRLCECFAKDMGQPVRMLQVDGGLTASKFLMQFQADLLHSPVVLTKNKEATAAGVAMMAALQAGVYKSMGELSVLQRTERVYTPVMDEGTRRRLLAQWDRAVERARGWAQEGER